MCIRDRPPPHQHTITPAHQHIMMDVFSYIFKDITLHNKYNFVTTHKSTSTAVMSATEHREGVGTSHTHACLMVFHPRRCTLPELLHSQLRYNRPHGKFNVPLNTTVISQTTAPANHLTGAKPIFLTIAWLCTS